MLSFIFLTGSAYFISTYPEAWRSSIWIPTTADRDMWTTSSWARDAGKTWVSVQKLLIEELMVRAYLLVLFLTYTLKILRFWILELYFFVKNECLIVSVHIFLYVFVRSFEIKIGLLLVLFNDVVGSHTNVAVHFQLTV